MKFTTKEKVELAVMLAGSIYQQYQSDGSSVKYDNWREGVAQESKRIVQEIIDAYNSDV